LKNNFKSGPHPLHSCLRPRCGALQHKGDEVKGGKELGQNYTELGREVIELIINRMNLKRLSTNLIQNSKARQGTTTFENEQALQAKIAELLSLPSKKRRWAFIYYIRK